MQDLCWQMLQKKVFWVGYTFLLKPSSFKFLSILEENCSPNINYGTFKCKVFVDKCFKERSLGELYFAVSYKVNESNSIWYELQFLQNVQVNQLLRVITARKTGNCKDTIAKYQVWLLHVWPTIKSLIRWLKRGVRVAVNHYATTSCIGHQVHGTTCVELRHNHMQLIVEKKPLNSMTVA